MTTFSQYKERRQIFAVVANSVCRGAFLFEFAVIASVHYDSKLSFFYANVFIVVTGVPPTYLFLFLSYRFIHIKVSLFLKAAIAGTKKANLL